VAYGARASESGGSNNRGQRGRGSLVEAPGSGMVVVGSKGHFKLRQPWPSVYLVRTDPLKSLTQQKLVLNSQFGELKLSQSRFWKRFVNVGGIFTVED
jgi:hypothetical protein